MRKTSDLPERSEKGYTKATRLTFSYQGDKVELIKQRTLEMIAPPSHDLEPDMQASGFWVTVFDKKNRPVYRRASESPIKQFAEVRADDTDRPLTMAKIENPSGIFTILIPKIMEAQDVALFNSASSQKKKLSPSIEIGRFELRDDSTGKED